MNVTVLLKTRRMLQLPMRFILLGVCIPWLAFGQALPPFPNEMATVDHGKFGAFEIAADEIAQQQADGRFQVKTENAGKVLREKTDSSSSRLVLYAKGATRTESNRRLLTEKMIVRVVPGTDVATLAAQYSIKQWKPAPALKDHYVFYASSALKALNTLAALRSEPGVLSADFLLARMQKRRGVPNDPLFSRQWHLLNRGQNGGLRGIDANVVPVWGNFRGAGYRGRGVMIGIVDDGVQYTHPDLRPNYDASVDYDWNDLTPSTAYPSQSNGDFHGTSVAGVAAARGNNGIGVCGVAPQARLTGLRLIADYVDDATEAEAFLYRQDLIAVKNNSWGPDDTGSTMEGPGPIAAQALVEATANGRGGLGTIFCWAAGNGREYDDNSNYDGYANSIYTTAVTAISNRGRTTYYGEPGSNVIVGAPSDNSSASGIVTTDLTGSNGYNHPGASGELSDPSYTGTFGGTSSATPVVSGVVALMLQRNPFLGWRDVQEILIRSARKNDASSPTWTDNAAGFHFNYNYGAGLVNAASAVQFAGVWTNLGPQIIQTQTDSTSSAIPDESSVTKSFNFTGSQRVEHVTVKLNITHPSRGQLRITLISPSGTPSLLANVHGDTNSNIDWTYMTVRNWGENAAGTWQLVVEDGVAGLTGTINSAQVTIYGSAP